MERPLIGVPPHYVVAQSRISSLAQAIDRFAGANKPDTELIKNWAKEIIAQCDLLEELSKEQT